MRQSLGWCLRAPEFAFTNFVIPAKAGIHGATPGGSTDAAGEGEGRSWTPACAGVTRAVRNGEVECAHF